MTILEQIQKKLEDRNAVIVAEKTGLSAATIRELKAGTQSNPTWHTIMVLSSYLGCEDSING